MLLLSRESELKMSTELFPDVSTQSKNHSFDLKEKFTANHQINLVIEDKHKQQAIFVTQSVQKDANESENQLID